MPNSYLGFIQEQEDFSPTAFKDANQYSIGYGTRTDDPDEIAGIKQIGQEEALRRLTEWTGGDREYIKSLGEREGLEWSENELDALTSFTYNLGRGGVSKLVSGRDKETIAQKMLEYTKSEGVELEGLVTRRQKEAELFRTPYEPEVLEVADTAEKIPTPEDAAVADRSYLDYKEPHIPMSVLRAEPAEGEPKTVAELWEAAKYRHWIQNSLERRSEAELDTFDPNYRVTMEDLVKYNDDGYTQEELSFLAQASSNENFAHRVARIKSDREAATLLEQGGMTGTGIEMLASVADPTLIPTFFLGGVSAAAGKWNSAKAIGLSMLSGSSQNVAAEYLLKMGDTQRTDKDLMLSAAAGALFSGTITAGVLGTRAFRERLAQANQVDAAHIDSVRDAMVGETYIKADESLSRDVPDPVARKRALTEKEIIGKLQEEVGSPADALSSKKIKAAKQEFRQFKKLKEARIAELRATKFRKPSSRNKLIADVEGQIAAKQAELDALVTANNAVLAKNSQLSALQQGHVPESLRARYDELKAEAGEISPPRESMGKSLPPRPPKQVDEAGKELPEDKSVGAMQTRAKFDDIQSNEGLLTSTDIDAIEEAVINAADFGEKIPRVSRLARYAKGFRSLSTQLDEAFDNATRGLAAILVKNGTRTIEGHQSVEEVAETLFFRNVPDYLSHEAAFDEFANQKGIGIMSSRRAALREEFDKQVVLLQASGKVTDNKVKVGDDPILQAAKARSRIYERSLKNNKDYGVVGFDNVEHSHKYHSVVFNATNILSMGDELVPEVKDCIAKAYQNGKIKLTRENAVRLAKLQVDRTFSYRSGGNGTFQTTLADAEFKLIDKELKDAGVDATTRQELRNSLFNKEELAHMSPRAMFSLGPDITVSSGAVRMVDLLDTDMNRVMKYASDSSANAGLASHGFKSRNQFLHAMEEARRQAIDELNSKAASTNPKIAKRAKEELAKVERGDLYNMMEDALKLIYREPLDSGIGESLEDLSKILRKQTSITRLRSTGLMSIPENAIAMARNGALNTLKQIPGTRYFDLRSRSIEKDEFMADFARTFSATGHQEYLFGAKFYNNSDFDDATRKRVGNIINRVQGKMMNVTMTVNAFRTFQHGGEEMVARSIIGNLKELAVKGEITPNVRSSLMKVGGMSEAQVDQMIKHFQANKNVEIFDSVRRMPPDLHNALAVAARNTIGSSFMRMGIGESVPYANRELGKIVTSLLNFSIGSWEKMVVRGIKSDGLGLMASMFAGQAALALMAQYAYVYTRASAMEKHERDKYIEKSLSDEGLFWGVFNRVGFLAAPTIPLQMLSAARLLPEEITASPTKAGISPASLPSLSMGADYFKAAGSAGDLISNTFSDEYMSNKDRERNWASIRRVLPWIDSPVYNFTIGQVD